MENMQMDKFFNLPSFLQGLVSAAGVGRDIKGQESIDKVPLYLENFTDKSCLLLTKFWPKSLEVVAIILLEEPVQNI